MHYYQDSSLNLGTVLPSIGTILVMQVLRGAFFLLAVMPIIFSWRNSLRSLILLLGAVIFIQIAATPILQGYWLPLGMRLPHALELLVDSYLQAITYAFLLFIPVMNNPMTTKHLVELSDEKRQQLVKLILSGKVIARQVKRSQILPKSDIHTN